MGACHQVENEVEASPFFSGSIADAIKTAKSEKRSLIVYIAGENEDCTRMDQITWKDHKVQELIIEHFVTLRLPHRSSDAAHFFAMYPYHEVPSISVINNNGMLLKQHGGCVRPEELLGMLEQTLAVQAAATIVAALASANPSSIAFSTQNQANNSSSVAVEKVESQKEDFSGMHDDGEASAASIEEKSSGDLDTGQTRHEASSQIQGEDASSEAREGERESDSQKQAVGTEIGTPEGPTEQDLQSTPCDVVSDKTMSQIMAPSRDLESNQEVNMDASTSFELKASSSCQDNAPKIRQLADTLLIQVRLTNGKSIRQSFSPKDNLALVKEFVDQNRDDGKDVYSLAMLYPRKVFSLEDLEKSLLELSLEDRATLVLVTSPSQPKLSASESSHSKAATPEVKDSGIWRILSYLNPLSYLSSGSNGNTSHNPEPGSSSWQYEPNPNLRNSLRQGPTERHGMSNPNAADVNTSKRKKGVERNWGGNIHTLQHNDNEEAFKRGNAFWNGNSTQYGGDDSQK